MNAYDVSSFEDFHKLVNGRFGFGVAYRGMRDIGYDLIPAIGRRVSLFEQPGRGARRRSSTQRKMHSPSSKENPPYIFLVLSALLGNS